MITTCQRLPGMRGHRSRKNAGAGSPSGLYPEGSWLPKKTLPAKSSWSRPDLPRRPSIRSAVSPTIPSGKMGYAIAKMAMLRGAEVTLVSGPTAIEPPLFVKVVPVTSARDMFEAVTGLSDEQDIIIKAAAVADYRPKQVSEDKVKKKDDQASIELERTDDILKYLGQHKKQGQFLCGFSMETRDMLRNSRAKLEKKNLDMVAANNLKVEGAGFQGDTNVLTLITQDEEVSLPLMSKEDAALKILDKILLLTTKAEA